MNTYLDIPLNERAGAILSYDIKHATVPLRYMYNSRNTYNVNQTAFGKLFVDIDSKSSLDVNVTLSEFKAEKFTGNIKDSDFDVLNPSRKFNVIYDREMDSGNYTLTAAFAHTELERDSDRSETYNWVKAPGSSTQWGRDDDVAKEGGMGDSYREEKDVTLKLDYESVPVELGPVANVFSIGSSYEYVGGTFQKRDDVSSYSKAVLANNVKDNGEGGIIANEQYAGTKTFTAAEERTAHYNTYTLYLEDRMNLWRFMLRPGFRIEHDDLMQNTNMAPRLAAEYDVLGDRKLVFSAGLNRYYGANLLGYALRATNPMNTYKRTIDAAGNLSSWNQTKSYQSDYSLQGLDTPYSDEMTFGLRSGFFGLDASLEYVKRKSRNQFATKKKSIYVPTFQTVRTLTNDGETRYWGYTLKLEKNLENHRFALGVTLSGQETNFRDFEDADNDGGMNGWNYDKVFYNGSMIDRDDLPAANFNRPWVGTFTYEGTFFDKLKFTNVTRYQGEVDTIVGGRTVRQDGERYKSYSDETLPSSIIWDWKIGYEVFSRKSHALQLDLIVDNVFDETAVIDSDGNRVRGRQFWAGATYTF